MHASPANIPPGQVWVDVTNPVFHSPADVDSTDAINRAISTAAISMPAIKYVYVPKGTYIINSLTGSDRPIRLQSGITLVGDGGRKSVFVLPPDASGAGKRSNISILVIGDTRYNRATASNYTQSNITIDSIGFDLVNDKGRRAIQLRYPASNVTVTRCEGFQSDLEKGKPVITGVTHGDNQFFNMAVEGEGSSSVILDSCIVRDRMQLSSDGGYGIHDLHIQNNQVDGAAANGIAVTTVSTVCADFDGIYIENNVVTNPMAAGITIGPDYSSSRQYDFEHPLDPITQKPRVYGMKNVFIRNNTIAWEPGASNAAGTGIGITPMIFGTSNVEISGNTCFGRSRHGRAISFGGGDDWDLNWKSKTFPSVPVLPTSALDAAHAVIHSVDTNGNPMPHHLLTGMLVKLFPASAADALPDGIVPFRYYLAERITPTDFALHEVAAPQPLVHFQAPRTHGHFSFEFAPAVQQVTVTNNADDGQFEESFWPYASIDADISNNTFRSAVRFIGDHQDLTFSLNQCYDAFFTSYAGLGTSFQGDTLLISNTWIYDEARPNATCCGKTAVVEFNPNTPTGTVQRTMTYLFQNNLINILNSKGAALVLHGLSDINASGKIAASYVGNKVAPAGQGYDCAFNHVVVWSNNTGIQYGTALPTASLVAKR